MKKLLLARMLDRLGCLPIRRGLFTWRGVLALNYHRIGTPGESLLDHELWSASAEAFDEQIRFLRDHVETITPADLPSVPARRSGRVVLVTFDDGYRDNYDIAFPILQRHGVRATFFITTGFLDGRATAWWDEIACLVRTSPLRTLSGIPGLPGPLKLDGDHRDASIRLVLDTYKRLPPAGQAALITRLADAGGTRPSAESAGTTWMTWDMVREMQAAGMVIGGHTVSHPVLAGLDPDAQAAEIAECGRRIAEELGAPMRYFSYPVGKRYAFDQVTRDTLLRIDVQYAFSYYGGYRSWSAWDDLDIRRVAVERYMTASWFKALVTLPRLFGAPA